MNITCGKKEYTSPMKGIGGQWVNKVGQYMYKNLDGAFKFSKSGNVFDVYITLLYQIPYLQQIPGKGKEYNDVHEMVLDLNITTYQNKLRINVIEADENERTLGHFTLSEEQLQSLEEVKKTVYNKVVQIVSKAYEDYDFLF